MMGSDGVGERSGGVLRTDGIDEEGRRIREGWAGPRRVRFFANAIHQELELVQPPLDGKERKGDYGTVRYN